MMNSLKEGLNKFLVIVLGLVSVILLLLILLIIFVFMDFRASLIPDDKEMEKVTEQAEQKPTNKTSSNEI